MTGVVPNRITNPIVSRYPHTYRLDGAPTTFEKAETTLTIGANSYALTSRYIGSHATATTWRESGLGTKNETLTFTGTAVSQYLGIPIPGIDDETAAYSGTGANTRWRTTASGRIKMLNGGVLRAIVRGSRGTSAPQNTICGTTQSVWNEKAFGFGSRHSVGDFLLNAPIALSGDTDFQSLNTAMPTTRFYEIWAFWQHNGTSAWYVDGAFSRSETAGVPDLSDSLEFWIGGGLWSSATAGGRAMPVALLDIWESDGTMNFGDASARLAAVTSMSLLPAQPSTFDGLPTTIKLGGESYDVAIRFNASDATDTTWADTGQGSESLTLTFDGSAANISLTEAITGVSDEEAAWATTTNSGNQYWGNASPGTVGQFGTDNLVVHAIYRYDDVSAALSGSFFTNGTITPNQRTTIGFSSGQHEFLVYDGGDSGANCTVAATAAVDNTWYETWYFFDYDAECNRYINRGSVTTSAASTLDSANDTDGGIFRLGGFGALNAVCCIALFEYWRIPAGASMGTDAEQKAIVDALSCGNV